MQKKCRRCGNYFDTNNGYTATMCDDCASGKPVAGRMVLGFEDTPEKKKARGLVQCAYCGKWYMPKKEDFRSIREVNYCSAVCEHDAGLRCYQKRKPEIHTCRMCGEEFETLDRHKYTCSTFCGKRYTYGYDRYKKSTKPNEPRKCVVCGEQFTPDREFREYCDKPYCVATWFSKKAQGLWSVFNKSNQPKQCEYCGVTFNPITANQRFCSVKCRDKGAVARRKKQQEARAKVVGDVSKRFREYQPKYCVVCGKRFKPKSGIAKCCSDECSKINHRNMANIRAREKRRVK